jgi:hypothetical protein
VRGIVRETESTVTAGRVGGFVPFVAGNAAAGAGNRLKIRVHPCESVSEWLPAASSQLAVLRSRSEIRVHPRSSAVLEVSGFTTETQSPLRRPGEQGRKERKSGKKGTRERAVFAPSLLRLFAFFSAEVISVAPAGRSVLQSRHILFFWQAF